MKSSPVTSEPQTDPSPTVPAPSTPHPSPRSYTLPLLVILAILLTIAAFFIPNGGYLNNTKQENSTTPTSLATATPLPTPTPTPYPLPQGKEVYTLSYSKDVTKPKITKVVIDPFDPREGQKQQFTVFVTYPAPIRTVTMDLQTDNKTKTYSLTKTSESGMDSQWDISFPTEDTHFYKYYAHFNVKSDTDEFTGGLTFRAY